MADNLRIRRDRSALADGSLFGRRKRRLISWKFGAWAAAMAIVGIVALQFNRIQPVVLAAVGSAPTATPNNVTYAKRGYDAYLRGDLEAAIDNYCRAAQGNPTTSYQQPRCETPAPDSPAVRKANVDVIYELVRVLVYRSYDDRRLNIYNRDAEAWGKIAADANPKSSRAHAIYAFALTNNDHSENAVPEGLSAISVNPGDADAHAFLSLAYNSSSRYSNALTEGEQAVALNEQSLDAHIAYAYASWVMGKYSIAEDQFRIGTTINPRLAFPYFLLAAFYVSREGKVENAIELAIARYDQVLSIDNKNVKAYTRKCAAYFNIGETTKALANCKNATTLDPSYTEAWKWQGQVWYNRRDYEDAITAFETCQKQENEAVARGDIKSNDRLPECWYLLGLAHYLLGDCKTAYNLFNEVLSFTDNEQAIRLTRQGINGCASKNPDFVTPTLIPTQTPLPAPIR